ncbi:MAG: hypothetical protein D0531_04455 [Methylococcales bacterium]|nr:MAG: hypothetical protein D0531_04455 [Methylococcales bacterium]
MTSNAFMPSTDSGKADLLDHVASILVNYASILEVTAEDLASLQADAHAFRYILKSMADMQAYAHHLTEFKNILRDGSAAIVGWTVPPMLIEPTPSAVSSGIIPRLSSLVAHLKSHKNYTSAIGLDLGVIGTSTVVDSSSWKPILNVQIKAGHPIVTWTKGSAAAIEIWVDRGEGAGFSFLTINTEPNTSDNQPLPTTSAVWKYRAIYRLHDEQVGQWSDVLSITVGV